MIPFKLIYELAYEGNIGIHELMMFYRRADEEQKDQLEHFLANGDMQEALALLELVTGVQLQR